jgi:5-methylthioribose kinase
MTVTTAKILTAETVPKYLEEHWDQIIKSMDDGDNGSWSLDGVQVKAIQGGNVNYAFCITFADGKTIFLKQVSFIQKQEKRLITTTTTRLTFYFASCITI